MHNFRKEHNLEFGFFIERLVLKLINEKITKILKENGKNVKYYNNFIKMILMRRIEVVEMENIRVKNQNVNNYIDH